MMLRPATIHATLLAVAVSALAIVAVLAATPNVFAGEMTKAQEEAMTDIFSTAQKGGDLFRAGHYAEAEAIFRDNLAKAEEFFPDEPLTVASAAHNLAAVVAQEGKSEAALAIARRALKLRSEGGGTPTVIASSQALVATILYDLGELAEAADLMGAAVQAQIGGAVINPGDMIENASQLVGMLADTGRVPAAEALLGDLLNLVPDLDVAQQVNVYWGAGRFASATGKLSQADAYYRRAYAALAQSAPDDIRRRAILIHNIASILRQQFRAREAEPLFRRAADDLAKIFPDGHPTIAGALDGLGLALAEQGRVDEAWPIQRAALDMRVKLLPAGHPLIATSILNLGLTLLRAGQFEIARDALQTATNRRIEAGDMVGAARAAVSLAAAQHALGETRAGINSLSEARSVFAESLPRGHPFAITASINEAWLLLADGDFAKALSIARDAAAGLIAARGLTGPDDEEVITTDEDKRRIVVNVAAAWEVARGN